MGKRRLSLWIELLRTAALFEEKTVRERKFIFGAQLKAIVGAISRCLQCSEFLLLFCTVFPEPGLRLPPDFQRENRPPFFPVIRERNVLTTSKPADFVF
jgi:hypothetical protein